MCQQKPAAGRGASAISHLAAPGEAAALRTAVAAEMATAAVDPAATGLAVGAVR